MKTFLLIVLSFATLTLSAQTRHGFTQQSDTAQYKGSDYANVVRVERGISLERAFDIAQSHPDIDYFVYVKGYQMALETSADFDPSQDLFHLASYVNIRYDSGETGMGYCRIFKQGDTVFFKKEGVWLGSAPGLADTYFKE